VFPNINFILILTKTANIIMKQSKKDIFFNQICKIINNPCYYENLSKKLIYIILHIKLPSFLGGVVLVEIVTENTVHGVLGIELHFLKLKHYLNCFVELKS